MIDTTAIDLFAGAGGATQGLKDAGIRVVAAIENDADAVRTYAANHPRVRLEPENIEGVDPVALRESLGLRLGDLFLITACPPCQGFSTLGLGNRDDPRNELVAQVSRYAEAFRPAVVLVENVPGLKTDHRFRALTDELESLGYQCRSYILDAAEFGVPQQRRRLIEIAVRADRQVEFPSDLHQVIPAQFRDPAPSALSVLTQADEIVPSQDPLSRPRSHTRAVLKRIMAIPRNGGRHDLPPKHRLKCHDRLDRHGASTVYSRIRTTGPAPTMTTRCTTPSCGRFIHPTKHRGITLREAALLQTFPASYGFVGTHQSVERQIGNALPVRLAEALGYAVQQLAAVAGGSA